MDFRHWMQLPWIGLGGYSAFFLLLFHKLLFFSDIWAHKDMHTFTYPFITLIKERLWSPDIFWNDLNGFGFPTFLTDGSVFNPLVLFFTTFLSPFQAAHWTMAVSLILGAWFCMLVFREWQFSCTASFITGLVYAMLLWPWFFNPSNAIITLALTPIILLLIKERLSPLIRYPCGIALTSVLFLSGFPHFVIVAVLAISVVVCAYALQALQRFVVILFVSGCIGLVRFLPLLAYGQLSQRTDAQELTGIGWNMLFYLFAPDLRLPGLAGSMEISSYIGLFPLLFVVLSFTQFHQRRRLILACGSIVALSMLLAAGPSFLQAVPLYKTIGSPARWLLLAKLAILPLVAIGCESSITYSRKRLHAYIALVTAILGIIMLPLLHYSFFNDPSPIPGIVTTFVRATHLHFPTNHTIGVVLLMIGVTFAVPFWKTMTKRQWSSLLAMTSAVSMLVAYTFLVLYESSHLSAHILPGLSRRSSALPLRVFSPASEQIHDRIVSANNSIWTKDLRDVLTTLNTQLLTPNINIHLNLPSAGLYEPMTPKRVGYLLAAIGSTKTRVPKNIRLTHSSEEEMLSLLKKRQYLLNSLSISHILSSAPFPSDAMTLLAKYPIYVDLPGLNIDFMRYIYANIDARLPVYLAPHVVLQEPSLDTLYPHLTAEPPLSDRTFVECPACSGTFTSNASGTVTFLEHSPIRTILQTQSLGDQWLIVAQNYLPGWKVTVDDQEIQPALAQGMFFAIPVPPSNHTIALRFSLPTLLRDSLALLRAPEKSIWLQNS